MATPNYGFEKRQKELAKKKKKEEKLKQKAADKAAGIVLQEDLSDCDLLLGIKEIAEHLLIPNKKYLFFSHTAKKQPQNILINL